ncbi:MAG TPA: TraB/GumN family protein, partial [Methylomirabilota bacterium]|nr:TraB/GumN family protein [Methylomirabilota bacterium]
MRSIIGDKWGAVAALAMSLSAASPAAAEPAMWIVSDDDTTVHLFGTIHLLAPETEWRSDDLKAAMEGADALWLEIDILRDTSGALAMITRGTSPDRPLKDRLGAENYAEVERAATEIGVPMDRIDRLRPWLAAVTLGMEAIRRSGFDQTGVDVHLASEAMERGLP